MRRSRASAPRTEGDNSNVRSPAVRTVYYSATQVSRMLHVKPHVLRYWEKKFEIKPERNSAGRRIYREDQIEKFKRVKFLRYREKLTIQGARSKLEKLSRVDSGKALPEETASLLLWLKQELTTIRDLLAEGAEQNRN